MPQALIQDRTIKQIGMATITKVENGWRVTEPTVWGCYITHHDTLLEAEHYCRDNGITEIKYILNN